MNKFIKYYLLADAVVLSAVFFSGAIDPSFWLYGFTYVGLEVAVVGTIVSLVWYINCFRLKIKIIRPLLSLGLHIVALIIMVLFLSWLFSGSIHFSMV